MQHAQVFQNESVLWHVLTIRFITHRRSESCAQGRLMPVWPVCACGLPMRGRWCMGVDFWSCVTVTFDLGIGALTLDFLWTLIWSWHWGQCGQFDSVDYPCQVDVDIHGYNGILVRWPWSHNLDIWNLVDAPVSMVLMLTWPVCACGLEG